MDIFTTGIAVDPTFGEFEDALKKEDESRRRAGDEVLIPKALTPQDVPFAARITLPDGAQDVVLRFRPGGRRINVGRGSDNDLYLNHTSVSKVHAALMLNREGTLLVADTGSTTAPSSTPSHAYCESLQIEDGDVVVFVDVEVRLKNIMMMIDNDEKTAFLLLSVSLFTFTLMIFYVLPEKQPAF